MNLPTNDKRTNEPANVVCSLGSIHPSIIPSQVPRYDPSRLINKLKQKCTASRGGSTFFDWKSLGYETGICFNAIPSRVSFLCGCLDSEKAQKERKERAARQRIAPDNAVEVRPDEVGGENNKGNADNLSAAEKLIKKVAKTLVKRSTEEHKKLAGKTSNEKDLEQYGPEIDGVRFLLDPLSFTHTVENIFAYSFLIKKGEAKVGVRSSMEATGIKRAGLYCGTMPSGDTEYPEATQAVISFTLNDWRRLCERWQEGDLPSRERNQQAKNSQTTQSQ